jgi:hypothetical protein
MTEQNTIIIVVIILVIVAIIYYFFIKPVPVKKESFNIVSDTSSLSKYYDTSALKDIALDKIPSHPSCCGTQWPMSDNLTPAQIQQKISNIDPTKISSNYTCANGPNGIGCPCLTQSSHSNLANRGQTIMALYDTNPNNRQVLSDTRCINDHDITRPYYDISKVTAKP